MNAQQPDLITPVTRRRLLIGLGLAFSIYLILLLLVNTGELLAQLRRFPLYYLVPLLLVKPLSWLCRFRVWHYFLIVAGVSHAIGACRSAILYLAGFTMAVSPGKSAEFVKALVLRRWTGLPLQRGVPVVLAERVVETSSVLMLIAVCLLAGVAGLDSVQERSLVVLAFLLLMAGLLFLHSVAAQRRALHLMARIPLLGRSVNWLEGFFGSSSELLRVTHLRRVLLPGMLATIGDAIVLLIILHGFGLAVNTELWWQSLLIVALTPLVGALSGLPNGAGITELTVAAMLLALVAPQHPALTAATAGAVALIESFFHKWLRVLVGLLVALLFRKRLFADALPAAVSRPAGSKVSFPAGAHELES